jgi:predicted transcriptional regulator
MSISHGDLENTILSAIWYIEENKLSKVITVNEVFALVQRTKTPRAYTTIKTVMDRLVEKKMLVRNKLGKKFSYNSLVSRETNLSVAIIKRIIQEAGETTSADEEKPLPKPKTTAQILAYHKEYKYNGLPPIETTCPKKSVYYGKMVMLKQEFLDV